MLTVLSNVISTDHWDRLGSERRGDILRGRIAPYPRASGKRALAPSSTKLSGLKRKIAYIIYSVEVFQRAQFFERPIFQLRKLNLHEGFSETRTVSDITLPLSLSLSLSSFASASLNYPHAPRIAARPIRNAPALTHVNQPSRPW
jgi:hypothetical protein